jgi:hypothetical protein
MNSLIKKLLSAAEMSSPLPRILAFGLLGLFCASLLIADDQQAASDVTVHEWGTFTSIAGKDGAAAEWSPLTGSTDLPQFVEHFREPNFKLGLRGTIRMETPVLYFYSPRDATVSVNVSFSKGVITEWYPHADRVEPSGVLRDALLSRLKSDGNITWSHVAISPNLSGEFPREARSDRYYAARETSSTPLHIKTTTADQQEKFLFYRGVSAAPLPLSAMQNADGRLLIKSLDASEIPAIILFERRGDRVGYRWVRSPTDGTVVESPELNGDLDSLYRDVEGTLVDQGLYPDEARAMVDTWFEEGSRLIYIVPRGFIDHILPLTINPAPTQIVRVFVGRLEIVTPATANAVETALASRDEATLKKYERFLEPILQTIKEEHLESTSANRNRR